MSVENLNEILSVAAYRDALKSGNHFGDILILKLTQRESQMVDSIKKILLTIDKHEKLNTSEIQRHTKLYSNTVNRVLKLLKMKKIVKVKNRKKYNNEKIFSLNRNRAIIYINHILLQKNKWLLKFKKMANIDKHIVKIIENMPNEFESIRFFIPESLQHHHDITLTEPITMNDMPYLLAKEILEKYQNEYFCKVCFFDGKLNQLIMYDQILSCKNCGAEIYEESESYVQIKNNTKHNKKIIDYQISQIKKGKNFKDAIKYSEFI